jgi:hypothetical protein
LALPSLAGDAQRFITRITVIETRGTADIVTQNGCRATG